MTPAKHEGLQPHSCSLASLSFFEVLKNEKGGEKVGVGREEGGKLGGWEGGRVGGHIFAACCKGRSD